MERAMEPYVLGVDGQTFPVYFKPGNGDRRYQITIVSVANHLEYVLHLPTTTVEILATTSKYEIDSHAFKEFLISHISMQKHHRKESFYFGQTRFNERPFNVQTPEVDLEPNQHGFTARRVVNELGDVLRLLGDQRCFQERHIWSNQHLFDALAKGFEQIQILANYFIQQEHVVKKMANDLDLWKAATNERTHRLDSFLQQNHSELSRLDNVVASIHGAVEATADRLQSTIDFVKKQRDEYEDAWKIKQKAMDLEAERRGKEWMEFRVDNKKNFERIKDAFGLIHEAQSRCSRQISSIASEVSELDKLKEKVANNSQSITQVKQTYQEIYPKLQDIYVLEKKREAIVAVQNLAYDADRMSNPPSFMHYSNDAGH